MKKSFILAFALSLLFVSCHMSTYDVNGVEYEAGQSVAEDAVTYNIPIAHPFKLTITSIDKNTMRGTFSGDHY